MTAFLRIVFVLFVLWVGIQAGNAAMNGFDNSDCYNCESEQFRLEQLLGN